MMSRADCYYLDIAGTIDCLTLTMWEDAILDAESRRLTDVNVMTIYAARLPATLPPDATSVTGSGLSSPPLDWWMELAILVEDTQCMSQTMWQKISSHSHSRIDIQDWVRRLGSHPHKNDQHIMEQKRQVSSSMLVKLKQFQETAGVMATPSGSNPYVC